MTPTPVTLRGSLVRLEPLTVDHAEALARVGLHPELWRLQPRPITSQAEMRAYVDQALADQAQGVSLPFTVVQAGSATSPAQPAGSLRPLVTGPRNHNRDRRRKPRASSSLDM